MKKAGANLKQIVGAVLQGLESPRYAAGPLAIHYCAGVAGVSIREYTNNASILANCVVRYYERFQPDMVWLSADTWVTAQAMGADVAFPGGNQPLGGTGEHCVRTAADIDRIPPPDPSSQGRLPLMIEALERIKHAIGDTAFIAGCFDQYPFSLACAMMGMEQVMIKSIEDPQMVEALMERGLEYGIAYANALAGVGVDMLSGGDSPAGLIGPSLYQELALPYEQRLIAALKEKHSAPVSLHICGNAAPILTYMASSGADILELDHPTDMNQACEIVDPGITIWGNLDPVGVLAHGSVEDVRRAARDVLETVRANGRRRFVLSSGCALPPETPAENLRAMLDAVHEFDVKFTEKHEEYEVGA